ncbi:hypothetical protein CDL12_28993 [Handroanthus impetiginosus]|uniref:F-box domain-containing protein n=1 Tax=Handroanthus impetiginosus TaxID=429701 RepID=A0A2G9FZP5_9LAMI|nr:hypothetical protein CDL12_28993 [Handroanthus impetiginosus]
MLAARELSIVWGNKPEYWQWIRLPESRFSEVAELLNVCLLEIWGNINTIVLSSCTNYAAYLVFTCSTITYGFKFHPANGSVSISGHEREKRSFYLVPKEEQRQMYQIGGQLEDEAWKGTQYPTRRDDGWMEVELGEYFVKGGEDGDLDVSLVMFSGNWKRGIVIQGIEIRPKE